MLSIPFFYEKKMATMFWYCSYDSQYRDSIFVDLEKSKIKGVYKDKFEEDHRKELEFPGCWFFPIVNLVVFIYFLFDFVICDAFLQDFFYLSSKHSVL